MPTKTPKERLLTKLEREDFVTYNEAINLGISKMTLSNMTKAETLFRPMGRIYTKNLDWLTDPIRRYAPACTLYPDAVISGVSALTYYDLTDEEERKVWLAFPQTHRVVNKEYRTIYPSGPSYSLGIVRHKCGKRQVRMYDREKSVVDAFKYLPIDVGYKALRAYLKQKDTDLEILSNYAKKMKKPLDDTIRVLLSDE